MVEFKTHETLSVQILDRSSADPLPEKYLNGSNNLNMFKDKVNKYYVCIQDLAKTIYVYDIT